MATGPGRTDRRPYTSPVRQESARRTQRRVVEAAGRLFLAHGYGPTSLADIAAAAEVARPTVFAAFGSKAALLARVVDHALAGDDEPVPVADRPWFRPVWEADDPAAVLDAYAGVCVLIARRASGVFEVVRRAADVAEETSQLWETMQRNRRAGARMVVDHLRTRGRLRRGLRVEQAVDLLTLFNDPAHYGALVQQRHWPEDRFRRWLAGQMRHALIGCSG